MRINDATIRLGTQSWVVRPLTLRQVQEIEPIVMENAVESKGNVGAAMEIVAIALRRDHPEAASGLPDLEATAHEIGSAMATVLRLGGFIATPRQGDQRLGESEAGVAPTTYTPA